MYGVSSRPILESKGVKKVKTSKMRSEKRARVRFVCILVIKWIGSVGFGRVLGHIEDLDEI